MTTAVYALSGDPITYGHIDIIKRAAKSFERLIVALGVNTSKKYLLTTEEKIRVAKESLAFLPNVEVMFFNGLLVDFAFEQNATVIVRGIRNAADFDFEQSLDQINSSQMDIDTFFLFSKSTLSHVSSSNVKSLQIESGLIHEYVPLPVKKLLEKKISEQLVFGVTGVMGSGKSYVAEQLEAFSRIKNEEDPSFPIVHNIELDKLAHKVYTEEKPAYTLIREKINSHFGTLDKKKIAELAFGTENSKEHVDFLNNIFKDPVMVFLRQELRSKKGIILINSALLVESDMLNICNNHVILVDSETSVRHERLKEFRKIDPVAAENRIKHMKTNSSKLAAIKSAISESHFGKIIKFDNTNSNDTDIEELYTQLCNQYNK
jgi:pantetheine-phosphate adenylyltransferase